MAQDWSVLAAILSWKDVIGPAVGAVGAVGGVIYAQHFKNRQYHEQQQAAADGEEMQQAVGEAQDLTERFKILMNSYEARIRDLTDEVAKVKDELRQMRMSYEAHQGMCRRCPYFLGLSNPDAAVS